MKSLSARNTGIAAVVLSGLLLAGCGQPGPLYMPKQPAKPAAKASAPLLPPPPSPATTE
ncbi:MAG: LPS translocon maturation chaperone LptM [Massilia sp.]